ncbi:putative ATP-dependent DEAD/H RNA helicase [Trypanosoma theileri]|uniref:Probable eukaryotic initiation factor 4A n=1 Tax=Trypanosoma theileri TaxID=67003 RepID=A0A1X0NPK0_9TRYP|nr:putative ATP-dependent DEAD/H RNA helicase [Trypanosoma theileri]ORC86413.1 putative ATP-dependent DEAD/H RNA helicase [Trypanosoma theileri]
MGKREREGSGGSTSSTDSLFSSSSNHKSEAKKQRSSTKQKKQNTTKKDKKERNSTSRSRSSSLSSRSSDISSSSSSSSSSSNSIDIHSSKKDIKNNIHKNSELGSGSTKYNVVNSKSKALSGSSDKELKAGDDTYHTSLSDNEYGNFHDTNNSNNNNNINNNNINNEEFSEPRGPAVRVDENVIFSDSDSSHDPFGGDSSASSADEADGIDDAKLTDIRERLLTHAQITAAGRRPTITTATTTNTSGKNSTTNGLQELREALLQPVTSTALTVVNATDESHDLMNAVVTAKLPPPPPEDAKRLRKLKYVDHASVEYPPIRRDFYVTPPDVKGLTAEEMKQLLKELDGAKVRGRNPPRPMRSWNGSGLPDSVLDVLTREGFQQPFAVQSLGAPALMSGRDLLVTAKTGSGKTLAYLLPLIRHCIGQESCKKGEGPIGLILVPTHELAAQIVQVAEKLCKAAQLRLVSSYGLTPLADNIKQCRAGCEVMVATPGRLLDLLTINDGSVLSLKCVSFVVVDEADRMFDSGFMEHVEAFLKNIRPDRQTALISATMPKELKKVIMHHLKDPVEITVGGKPTPASNVEQRFFFFDEEVYEVEETNRTEDKKFLKLLQILGDEGGQGEHLVIIFTQRKDECDELFARLSACGYQNRLAVLYSGMDPLDREFALEYFAPGNQFILIATGVAERGLDIPYLELVINYTLPDHYEAYVHRIGRTGRAGKKGKAVSFFTREKDDDIAADLCEGLERAQQQVPEELYERAAKMREKRKEGVAQHNTGFYRGYRKAKKLRFTDRDQKEQFKAAARAAGLEEYLSASSCSDSDLSDEDQNDGEDDNDGNNIEIVSVQEDGTRRGGETSTALTLHKAGSGMALTTQQQQDRVALALAYARKTTEAIVDPTATGVRFEAEYPINDLPELVRLRMQSAALLRSIAEETSTTIIRKGVYYDRKFKHSHRLRDGVRPLYLLLIGKTAEAVRDAVKKLNDAKAEAQSRIQKKTSALGAQI